MSPKNIFGNKAAATDGVSMDLHIGFQPGFFLAKLAISIHLIRPSITDIHHQKLTWNLEMVVSNRNLLFQGSMFRFHVCFGGCTWDLSWIFWWILKVIFSKSTPIFQENYVPHPDIAHPETAIPLANYERNPIFKSLKG